MALEDSTLFPEERTFAAEVKKLREERGWTQSDLADRLRAGGIDYASQSTVSRIEKGLRPVRMIEAQMLAQLFDRPVQSMTHPDGREVFIAMTRNTLRDFRRKFVAFKENLLSTAAAQVTAAGYISDLTELFADEPSLDPATHARLTDLLRNLEQFRDIDLAKEASAVIAQGVAVMDSEKP